MTYSEYRLGLNAIVDGLPRVVAQFITARLRKVDAPYPEKLSAASLLVVEMADIIAVLRFP